MKTTPEVEKVIKILAQNYLNGYYFVMRKQHGKVPAKMRSTAKKIVKALTPIEKPIHIDEVQSFIKLRGKPLEAVIFDQPSFDRNHGIEVGVVSSKIIVICSNCGKHRKSIKHRCSKCKCRSYEYQVWLSSLPVKSIRPNISLDFIQMKFEVTPEGVKFEDIK